jgi:hypothetical protein
MPCNCRKPALLVAGLTLLLPGCDGGDGYQAISGKVTFKGAPLKHGSIQFFLVGEKSIPCAGAMIQNGVYQVPKEHGLKPGTYLVKISSTERDENAKGGSALNPALVRETIPPSYNSESTLKVEIVSAGSRQFDFNVE